jgi:hypothetical protein
MIKFIKNIFLKIGKYFTLTYLNIKKLFNNVKPEKEIENKNLEYSQSYNYFELVQKDSSVSKDIYVQFDEYIKELDKKLKDINPEDLISLKVKLTYFVKNSDTISKYETASLLTTKTRLKEDSKHLKKEIIILNEKYNVKSISTLSLYGFFYTKTYKLTTN